jgi:hypothetical protein
LPVTSTLNDVGLNVDAGVGVVTVLVVGEEPQAATKQMARSDVRTPRTLHHRKTCGKTFADSTV